MDQELIEYASDTLERFWHNIGHFWSDHAFNLLVIFLVAWLAKRYGGQFVTRIFHSTIRADLYPTKSDRIKRLETIDSITNAILQIAVYIIAGIMIVSELGVNTTPIVASAGVLGVALGFGAQSLIKDFTSGIFIIIDNQYRVGDIVRLDKITGKVEAITIRTTVLRAFDGTLYHVPNGSINATANLTMSFSGIEEDIIFDSDTDITKLAMIIDKTGKELADDPVFKKMIIDPPHFLRVVGLDVNGIKVKILGRTTASDSWEVRGEFYKRLIVALRKAHVEFPATQVIVKQEAVESKKKR